MIAAHKFNAGQTVQLVPSGYISNTRGSFTIVCALPEEHGIYHYRIRSTTDGHERVVTEGEVT
jgi:hypothetical protein